jgi:hypothetical protein
MLTEAAMLASGGEAAAISKKTQDYIREAAELGLKPSTTVFLANVLCADSGKPPRETLDKLISEYVENHGASADDTGLQAFAMQAKASDVEPQVIAKFIDADESTVQEQEEVALALTFDLMKEVCDKENLAQALMVPSAIVGRYDALACDLEKDNVSLLAMRGICAVAMMSCLTELGNAWRDVMKSAAA